MKMLIRYLRPYRTLIIVCLLFKTVASFCELFIPALLGYMIDDVVPREDLAAVLRAGGAMLFLALMILLFHVLGNRTAARASGYVAHDLRRDLFLKTAALDAEAIDAYGTPSLTSRLTTDSYHVTAFLARLFRLGVKAPLMLIGGVVITLILDARLAVALIATLPLVSLTVWFVTRRATPLYYEEQTVLDEMVRKVDETASGIRVIKALSKTEYETEAFCRINHRLEKKEVEAGSILSLTKPLCDLLLNLGLCAVILIGTLLAAHTGFHAAGTLLSFMTYFTVILNNMIMMTRIFIQLSRCMASAGRIAEVLSEESRMPVLPPSESRDAGAYLRFEDVTFSYKKKTPDLRDVSFSLGRGQTLGVIGATGSGKSTLISLLLRLYDPDKGRILLDGRDIRSYPYEELRKKFGVCFQYDFIPSATLAENVVFFRDFSEAKLFDALDTAQASSFALGLPEGVDSHIDGRGANLSGGQKQRLTLARALYGSPEILILDDATSALDYKTDRDLRSALKKREKTTAILVSQRIATVKDADRILFLSDGRITGNGTHEELMATHAEYRAIAEMQGR